MNKKLMASLAAAMVLGVSGTSFAATNPFTDVPAKHWSYEAVSELAKAGVVDGYIDGTFRGDKVISRYEMAQIVAKAMAHSDKATAQQKASIDKLSVEFASELEGLNVRITKLEKKSSNVKITGEARLRYENYSTDDSMLKSTDSNAFALRSRVSLTGAINDDWSYVGRLQAYTNLRGDKASTLTSNDNNVTMQNVYVKGPLAGATATVGRFDYFLNNGLMIDSTLNGAQFEFGNALKTRVFYGNENHDNIFGANDYVRVLGTGLNYGVSKATSINGGYYQFKNSDSKVIGAKDSAKVWEIGVNTKIAADWAMQASYGKSDADTQNKAYFTQFDYKGANTAKTGTYGAWIGYRHLDAQAAPQTTFDGAYAFNSQIAGAKGYELGFSYVPMTNSLLKLKYADLKSTQDGVEPKSKYYLAQMEFFF